MEVWLFGNPDLPQDSLPLRLQSKLAAEFPRLKFVVRDPLDEWPKTDKFFIIDAVNGLAKTIVFTSLDDFASTPLVSVHDFDLKNELAFRAKLNKLPPFVIFGVPPQLSETEAFAQLKPLLSEYVK